MRKLFLASIAVVVLLAGAGAAFQWWTYGRFIEGTDNAYLQADAVAVAARIEGYIRELKVEENARVEQGDVLAVLDERNYRARADQAAATVDSQRAKVGEDEAAITVLQAQIALQRSVVAQMKADVAAAAAEAERASLDFKRYESLAATKAATTQRFETATSDDRKAAAGHTRAVALLKAEQQRLPVLESTRRQAVAKLDQSNADLAAAEAALALTRIDVDDTVIRAPIAGTVGNRVARNGQYVKAGVQLMTIVPHEPYITANFKETQLTSMRRGQKVSIAIDAYPDHSLEGEVDSFAPATGAQFSVLPPENASGNFTKIVQRVPVRIRILNRESTAARLRSGLSVIVSVDTRSSPTADSAPKVPDAPPRGGPAVSVR